MITQDFKILVNPEVIPRLKKGFRISKNRSKKNLASRLPHDFFKILSLKSK